MSILNFESWLVNESVTSSYINGVSDREVIAATIIGEAGGEGINGMQAIKNVLDNRSSKKKTSLAGEALRPRQFSMWDKATDGVSLRSDYDPSLIKSVISKYTEHVNWDDATMLASKNTPDITKGANMYYSHTKIDPPSWTKNWKKTTVIGNHTFGIL